MSDVKTDLRAFIELPRVDADYRPINERVHDFKDIATRLPETEIKKQGLRCMDCGVPFCQSETGCPLGNLIPEWNRLSSEGRWEEALEHLHATNNFPEFTSHLCPAPCESSCVLGLAAEPVAIKSLEREIIERGYELGLIVPKPSSQKTGKRIAIIGSGPAGLTAAQILVREGHDVFVFEKSEKLGGLLRYGIPDFKMDKNLIDRRLEQMTAEGVTFQTNSNITPERLQNLEREFDAVALTIGAERPRDFELPGRDLKGLHYAMEFLSEQNRVIGNEKSQVSISAKGKHVVVIGGGDTGSDCVGTAIRQGAKTVRQFEHNVMPPSIRASKTPWPEWPYQLRTSTSQEEGVIREFSMSTKEFRGEKGFVKSVIAEQDGNRHEFPADLVLLAMGYQGPEPKLLETLEFKRNPRGHIVVDRDFRTSRARVYAAGDVKRGASLIVWAMAEGRDMARAIHRDLR